MTTPPVPAADAARALDTARSVRDRVISTEVIPDWYWPALGGLILLLVASIESRRPWIVAAGSVLYAAGLGALIAVVVTRRPVQLRGELIGVRGAVAIVAFTLGLVAIGLGGALALLLAGVPYPATIAVGAVAVAMTALGPVLVRHLRRLMLAQPLGGVR
jgi:hypothetical protein